MAMQQGVDLILPIIASSHAFALVQIKNYSTQESPCPKSHDCTYDMLPSIAKCPRFASVADEGNTQSGVFHFAAEVIAGCLKGTSSVA